MFLNLIVVVSHLQVKRMKDCPFKAGRLRDLQSAHHRHSSVARPLGRFVSLFDAILSTAQESLNSTASMLII